MRTAVREVWLVREHLFTPQLQVRTYDELNAWLVGKFTHNEDH
jgi:hypothetical protein